MNAPGALDRAELQAALCADIERLAETLLGPPSRQRGIEARWGRKGSLVVTIAGPKRGQWYDHEEQTGGYPLALIAAKRSYDDAEAAAWAADWCGLDDAAKRAQREQAVSQARQRHAGNYADKQAKRIAWVRRELRHTVPLASTPDDDQRYVVETRGIPVPQRGWCDDIRFDPRERALVAVARNGSDDVTAAQWIYLTPDARKITEAETAARELPAVKVTRGVATGATVRLPGRFGGPLQIAEGPEDGLAVWVATGCETWIALGGIGNVDPPAWREIVVCANDDPRHSPAARALRKGLNRWRARGVKFVVAKPSRLRREDKSDFADLIRAHGSGAIRNASCRSSSPALPRAGRCRLPWPVSACARRSSARPMPCWPVLILP
jgi:putative DNA primase/helicase